MTREQLFCMHDLFFLRWCLLQNDQNVTPHNYMCMQVYHYCTSISSILFVHVNHRSLASAHSPQAPTSTHKHSVSPAGKLCCKPLVSSVDLLPPTSGFQCSAFGWNYLHEHDKDIQRSSHVPVISCNLLTLSEIESLLWDRRFKKLVALISWGIGAREAAQLQARSDSGSLSSGNRFI